MVSIDPYLNETTRHAHVILPPTSPLERSHYDARAQRVRGAQRREVLAAGVRARAPTQRHDWEICLALWSRLGMPQARLGRALAERALAQARPRGDPRSRAAHRPLRHAAAGLSLAKLRAAPHGLDLGPLEPRLPERLGTQDKQRRSSRPRSTSTISPRLERAARGAATTGLVLIGRRHLRSQQLVDAQQRAAREGPAALHAADPSRRRRRSAASPTAATGRARRRRPAAIERAGRGHRRDDARRGQPAARLGPRPARARGSASRARRPGATVNDVTSEDLYDALSGNAALSGLAVAVTRA